MITVKTRYTLKTYSDYYWFCMFRGKYYRYGQTFFGLVTAMITAMAAFFIINRGPLAITIVLSVMVGVCILFYVAKLKRPGRYVKRYPALFQSDIEIIFDDNGFSSKQTGDLASGASTAKYALLQKVYETKDAFYIYIAPGLAMLLAKADFAAGDPEKLRELLRAKLPAGKYVLCK